MCLRKYDYGTSPGEFFLGIPAEVFENSCGISQLGCSSVKGEQISTAIRNLLSSADESIDYQKAIKALDNVRIKLLHKDKRGGSIHDLTLRKEELESSYIKAVDDSCETERIDSELQKLDDKISEVSSKQKLADELSSKINLRSVIKLFDKLHESEDDKKACQDRIDEINSTLKKETFTLDRSFVAQLSSAKNELQLSFDEYKVAKKEVHEFTFKTNKEATELIEKLERAGGIDTVSGFIKNSLASIKKKTTLFVTFSILTVIFASTGFLPITALGISPLVVCLPFSALMLILALAFIFARAKAKSKLKEKCNELGTTPESIQSFLSSAENVLSVDKEEKTLFEEKKAQLGIKERVLDSSLAKCTDVLKKQGITVDNASAELLINESSELVRKVTELCNEHDELSGKLSALNSKIKEISIELCDYNEHQVRHKVSKEILSMSDEEIREAKKTKSFLDLQLKALGEKKLAAERTLLQRKYSTQSPFDIAAKLSKTNEQLSAQTNQFNSLVMAIDALDEASANLRNTIAPKVKAVASEYMSHITDGKYDSVSVSDTLEMSMNEDGFSYHVDFFSAGTKDVAYFALRLSILSLLQEEEYPPLILDETLAMIDDKRATKLLSMLSDYAGEKGQCILLCCHDREVRICHDAGILFSSIVM